MKYQKTRELVVLGVLTGVVFAAQIAMSFLPNIELVSLLVLVYTLVFGKKVFPVIYAFVFLEGIFYGFGIWWATYLYIWSVLALTVLVFRKQKSVFFWSIVSGFFGLFFGALCALPYFFIGGWKAALAYWLSGIPFDLVHCAGNAAVCLALFKPLHFALDRLAAER